MSRSQRRSRFRLIRPHRQRVDHLSRTCIVQRFARLVFNRTGIVLQPVNMPPQQIVLPLERSHLLVQHHLILSLLFIDRQAILAKNDMVTQRQRQYRRSPRGNLTPARIEALAHAPKTAMRIMMRNGLA